MRKLLIFLFVTTGCANRLGYKYQLPEQVAIIGNSGYVADGTGNGELQRDIQAPGAAVAFSAGLSGLNSYNDITNCHNSAAISGNAGNVGSDKQLTTTPVKTEYSKEFYSYIAADDDFNDYNNMEPLLNAFKRKLRVIFIKAPENKAFTNAVQQLAKQTSEDRTEIYVLTKQPDFGELASQLKMFKTQKFNKPEVHFVKYRAQEDALRAQQAIRAQYDLLGGKTLSSNEGVAPVLDFVTPVMNNRVYSGIAKGDTTAYLPPVL